LLTPHELLETLKRIEKEAGRERLLRWGPRTLDLDIIFYDDLIYGDEDLCIPHADYKKRDFVLAPLAEIAPYKHDPSTGKTMVELFEELK
jgi:dihydroneopterin aldolase/2-amino-4-hydroxy-6-hydroxymethyldihydropteridine diphosphokinase